MTRTDQRCRCYLQARDDTLGGRVALRGLRERPLDFIMEMAAQYGDLVYFGSLRTPLCFVNHPSLIREVLVSRTHDFVRADAVRKYVAGF